MITHAITPHPAPFTSEQAELYRKQGFVIVENLLTPEEIDAFLRHMESGQWKQHEGLGLRMHTVDPVWKYLAHHPNLAGVAGQLLEGRKGGRPRIVQSMYLPKSANQKMQDNAGVAMHQDTHYLPSEPNTLMACWVALTDTDAGNGGFCVVPASHTWELQNTHLNQGEDHVSWEHEHLMRDRQGKEWKQKFYSFEIDGIEKMDIHRLTIPRGAGIFFHGMLIHGSFGNRSNRPRLAWAVHYLHEDSWMLRADVGDTVLVEEFSRELAT